MIEPGYCDHGKALKEPCYFCQRGRKEPRRVAELRNPPAREPETAISKALSIRGKAGARAAAASFAQRGRRARG